MQRSLNTAVSAYGMVPHRATSFPPFVLPYIFEAVAPYEMLFTKCALKEQYQDDLSSCIKKKFKIYHGAFLSNRCYQMKMKENF